MPESDAAWLVIATWPPGRSTDRLVSEVLSAMEALGSVSPAMAEWWEPDGSPEPMASRKLSPGVPRDRFAGLATATAPGLRGDEFIFMAWNGRRGSDSARLSVEDNLHLPLGDRPGWADLELPTAFGREQAIAALRTIVHGFEPAAASATTSEGRSVLRNGRVPGPVAYVSLDHFDYVPQPGLEAERLRSGLLVTEFGDDSEPLTVSGAMFEAIRPKA